MADCSAKSKYFCNYCETPLLMCKGQRIGHCEQKEKHDFAKINEETRKAFLKQLSMIKRALKLYISKIIYEELTVIKQIQRVSYNSLKNLKFQEQKLNECIAEACSLKEVDASKENTFVESMLKLPPTNLTKIKKFKPPKFSINHIKSDDINQLFELEDLWSHNTIGDGPTHLMKYIWSCKSTKLSIFNAKALKIENICLPNIELDQYGAKCLLPDGSLFYYNNPFAIIIDPAYQIKSIPNYPQKVMDACAIYKDGEIYLIGGLYKTSVKFNMAQQRWFNLANIPICLSNYTAGSVFKNYILLGSIKSDKIFYHDTAIDSYSKIFLMSLTKYNSKVFFVENEIVYLIEFSRYIYSSKDYLATWDNIGSSLILSPTAPIISIPIVYFQKIYFATFYGIYTFDLRKIKIEKILTLYHK